MAFDALKESSFDSTGQLSYLIIQCESPAKQAVAQCSVLPANMGYLEAVRIQHYMFGKPLDVGNATITDLFAGTRVSVSGTARLTELVTQISKCSVK